MLVEQPLQGAELVKLYYRFDEESDPGAAPEPERSGSMSLSQETGGTANTG